jgi:hypothetical protein
MDNEIQKIIPPPLPFSLDEKIFVVTDEETGEAIGEPYSYNDFIQTIKDISGINPDLTFDPNLTVTSPWTSIMKRYKKENDEVIELE